MPDIVSGFQELGIDTKSYASGKHYVVCPQPECQERKKKSEKKLFVDFSTGYYHCYHCGWTGYVKDTPTPGQPPQKAPRPVKVPQKFIDEPKFNWIFPDTVIDPIPENPGRPEGQFTVTFYYRNLQGKITSAKRMVYNFKNNEMKRDKDNHPLFLFQRDSGYYPSLFHEHLIAQNPKATVVLVESEKTACFMNKKFKDYQNEFVFVATGGTNGLTDEKMPALRGRTVWIVFDCDQGDKQPDGTVKNERGREHAQHAHEKLSKIADSRVIDLDPSKTDGTDLADIYRSIDIDFIRTLPEKIPANIRQIWDEVMLQEEPPPDVPIIVRDGITMASRGNHSLVTGKKKSRKTLFLVLMITWFLENHSEKEIVLFDTEQGKSHVWKIRKKVHQITGKWIPVFFLRGKTIHERQFIIRETVTYWPTPLKWVIIDGVRDLVSNINDADSATDIIVWLEKMIVRYGIHITNVLHQNKGDDNPRGHLGTELANKAEMTYDLRKDAMTGITMVSCESSREKEFIPFGLVHDANELPQIVGIPEKEGTILPDDEQKRRLELVFNGNVLNSKELLDGFLEQFGARKTKAYSMIGTFKRNGWIIQNGKSGAKGTVYKLVTSAPDGPSGIFTPPMAESGSGMPLFKPAAPKSDEQLPPSPQPGDFEVLPEDDLPF